MRRRLVHVYRDVGIVALSVLLAVFVVQSGVMHQVVGWLSDWWFLASFVNGAMFSSVFTTAPSIAIFYELGQELPPLHVALIGSAGALLADLVIFRFVRDELSQDIAYVAKGWLPKGRPSMALRVVSGLLGAIVIASPLPDELGVMLLGAAKLPTRYFVPLSLSANFLGILAITSLGRA